MRRAAPWVALAVLFGFVVACSWIGIDFGTHWDEFAEVVKPVRHSIAERTILPLDYNYPSLLHEVLLLSIAPHLGRSDLLAWTDTNAFILRSRRIASFLAALSVVWLFAALYGWRRNAAEALAGAAILAGSWEAQYHSRWLTVDPLLMMLGAATLMLVLPACTRQSLALLRAAAVTAGLACGAKYPGGALLLPVVIAALFTDRMTRRLAEVLALFAVAFAITTPGILLEPGKVLHDVEVQMRIYGSGWGAYTVAGHALLLRLIGEYVSLVMLSRYAPIAAGLFALAILGGVALFRQDRRLAAIVLSFPVAFVLYFATQRVLIVRNLLVLAPFLAFLAARGIGFLLEDVVRSRGARLFGAVGIGAMLLVNLVWIARAAHSIAVRDARADLRRLSAWLDEHPDRRVALSPRVTNNLGLIERRARPAESPLDPDVDDVVFYALDIPWPELLANRRGYATTWFGPYEVNYDYYPTWMGADRIVVMPREHFLWRPPR
jgi:hypothetical protein